MKKVTLIFFLFFIYSNLFSQIFVDNMIFRDIIKDRKEVKIDYEKLKNYLLKFSQNKKSNIKKQGVYVAIELNNNVFANLEYINYQTILSIEKESVTTQNGRKILKSKILDYAIKENGELIEGAFLYNKLISPLISKHLPDIIVDDIYSRKRNHLYVIFDECLQKYNSFNYKSLYVKETKLDSLYIVKHQIYPNHFFYNNLIPMERLSKRLYVNILSKIDPQKIYSISIRYNPKGGFITRKGHSLINLKKKTKLQPYFGSVYSKIDSVSNLLYETTFQIDYNGQPKSENEKSIRIISFLYDNVVYKVVENFYGYSDADRSLKKLPQLFYSNNEKVSLKKATEIQSKINDLYLDELKKMLFKEKFILLRDDNRTQFRNVKSKSLEFIKEGGHNIDFVYYYDKTIISIINDMEVALGENVYTKTDVKYNSTIYYEFNFDTRVSKNSDENIKIDDNLYDKKIIEKYYNRIKDLNKKVCKKINGEYINEKCKYYVKNVKF